MKLKDINTKPPKILLMGTFGTGKTVFSTSLGSQTEVLDLNRGLRSAFMFKDEFSKERAETEVKQCWDEEPERAKVFPRVRSFVNGIASECKKGTYKKKILVVDSYTDLATESLRNVLDGAGILGKQPQIQHWGAAFLQLENLMYVLRTLPIVVILTSHIRRVETGDTTTYILETPGKNLPQKIPTFFDEVWCAKIRGKDYVLQTTGTSGMACRTRSGLENNTKQNVGLKEVLGLLGYDVEKETKR